MNRWEKSKVFLMGAMITLAFVILLGAGEGPKNEVGRYQMQGAETVFLIMDTATGETKEVRYGSYNQYDTPFSEMDARPSNKR